MLKVCCLTVTLAVAFGSPYLPQGHIVEPPPPPPRPFIPPPGVLIEPPPPLRPPQPSILIEPPPPPPVFPPVQPPPPQVIVEPPPPPIQPPTPQVIVEPPPPPVFPPVPPPSLIIEPPPPPVTGKPAVTPKVLEFDCVGLEDGHYHNPKKACSQFYISCVGGDLLWRACPKGLKFEMEVGACWPEKYVRVCGGNPDLATTTLATVEPSTRPPVPFNCLGLEDGSYYDSVSRCSNRYFRCSGEEATMAFCPNNLVYDGSIDECEAPIYVLSCGGQPRPPTTTTPASTTVDIGPPFNCELNGDGNYPHPFEPCSDMFISCSGGAKNTIICQQGMRYDLHVDQCMPPDQVPACGGAPTLPTTTPLPTLPTEPTPHPLFNCLLHDDGNYPDPRFACSDSFFSCVGGVTSVRSCPEAHAYDLERDQCDLPEYIPACGGVTTTTVEPSTTPVTPEVILFNCVGKPQGDYADPFAGCSQSYYSCAGKRGGELRHCAPNTFFDGELGRCVFFEQHPICTGTPRTEPPETTTLELTTVTPRVPEVDFNCPELGNYPDPLAACSTRYIACAGPNAFPEVIECVLGTFYDAELGQCARFAEVPVCSGQPRPTTTTFNPLDTPKPPLPVDCAIRPDGFYAPQDRPCPRFFVQCRANQGIRVDCPQGLAYSDENKTCLSTELVETCDEAFYHE